METPVSLLERLRQPEPGLAWARFVDLYTPLLFGWARQAGCQESDAADLVQDVFCVLVRKLPEFAYDQRRGSFRGWLHTVTLNKWREHCRRLARQRRADVSDLTELPGPDAQKLFEEAEYRRHLVHQALRTLRPEFPPPVWEAFHRSLVAGRDVRSVAAELGLKVGAVYAARSRVLGRLRQELDRLLD